MGSDRTFIIGVVFVFFCFQPSLFGAAAADAITADDFYIDNSVMPRIIKDINSVDADGSVTIHQFVFSDKNLLKPLLSAHERGARIKLVLSPRFKKNKESMKMTQTLSDAGVRVVYKDTHEK